jgi:hypothetical protein
VSFLDKPIGDMTLADLTSLVRQQILVNMPPIPAGVAQLDPLDVPLVKPDTSSDAQVLTYVAAQDDWVPANTSVPAPTPPSGSFTPVLLGGIGSLFVSWTPLTGTDVTYTIYCSTNSGITADPSVEVGVTKGGFFVVKGTNDGSGSPNMNVGLDYGSPGANGKGTTAYYVLIVASNASGSVTSGTSAAGYPQQALVGDLAANSVTANQVAANSIYAGSLQDFLTISTTIETASSGQRVIIDSAGIRLIGGDGSTVLVNLNANATSDSVAFQASGQATLNQTTIQGNLTVQGTTNVMDKGSKLQLNSGQADPGQALIASLKFDSFTFGADSFYSGKSLLDVHYDAAGGTGGGTAVYYGLFQNGTATTFWLAEIDASSGAVLRNAKIGDLNTSINGSKQGGMAGVVRVGTKIYVLSETVTGSGVRLEAFTQNSSSFAWVNRLSIGTGLQAPIPVGGMVMTTDATNICILNWNTTPILRITIYDTSGNWVSTNNLSGGVTWSDRTAYDQIGVAYDGTNYLVVTNTPTHGGVRPSIVEKYNKTTFAYVSNSGAMTPTALGSVGPFAAYNSSTGALTLAPFSAGSAVCPMLRMTTGLTFTTSTTNLDFWFGYNWTDGSHITACSPPAAVSVAQSITHGQDASAPSSGAYGAQYGYIAITATLPTGMTAFDWFALGPTTTSTPATSTLKAQSTTSHVDSTTSPANFISYDGSGAAPGANNFPGGTSNIVSSTPANSGAAWSLGGDGKFLPPAWSDANLTTEGSGMGTGALVFNTDTLGPMVWDGVSWVPVGENRLQNPRFFELFSECNNTADDPGWVTEQLNTGIITHSQSSGASVSVSKHVGLTTLSTGTTSVSGSASMRMGSATQFNGIVLGDGWVYASTIILTPSALTQWQMRFGVFNSTVLSATAPGYQFFANPDAADGWTLIARDQTPANHSDTTTFPTKLVVSNWYFLEILIAPAGTSAQFNINRAGWSAALTLTGSLSTVTPYGPQLVVQGNANKVAGTARVMTVDNMCFSGHINGNRWT